MADKDPGLGTIGVVLGLIGVPRLPAIVAEWAAILPLVIHLAGSQDDYITLGDVSLLKRLPVSLFPSLGTFSSIARLLERSAGFLDYASTNGGSAQTVWDVNWGSVFPVANGGAMAAIISSLERNQRSRPTVELPLTAESTAGSRNQNTPIGKRDRTKYRPQVLKIYDFKRNAGTGNKTKGLNLRTWLSRRFLRRQASSVPFQCFLTFGLVGLCVFLIIFGAFGTAATVLVCAISILAALSAQVHRPAGYLRSTEEHDACMLVAPHQNATEWHLYIGDRAVVDTLLNKPMIMMPEGRYAEIAATWFRFAHIAQLLAMTFVASQKGWDGVCLIILLTAHYALSYVFSRDSIANDWLEKENITVEVQTFEFISRATMIGAIQVFSNSKIDSWMDTILVPHPRRNFWLQILREAENRPRQYPEGFAEHDKEEVERNCTSSRNAGETIRTNTASVRSHMA